MRVLVLGGTRFIGRRITELLTERGDDVLVVHRGVAEPGQWVSCRHLHTPRQEFARIAADVRTFDPDAVVDTLAMTSADVAAVLPHLPEARLVVLSSMDVYRAYELAVSGRGRIPVPLGESSPTRLSRYPHKGADPGLEGYEIDMDAYDKLDVEPPYLERGGATVLRLGMVYGARDPQRREEFVLRRVRAGHKRIPVGAANWLWTRVHVDDVARAVLAAVDTPSAAGEIFNIGETVTGTMRDWISCILSACDHEAELVTVPADRLPPDLFLTGDFTQHLLFSSEKARHQLGWRPEDPGEAVARSVRWHLAHPPATAPGLSADDRAFEL